MDNNQPKRKYVEAPAGHGKTEKIADIVATFPGDRVLILTHTNAGVNSLQKRLKKKGVPSSKFDLLTIDAFCLKYSQFYPSISGVPKKEDEIDSETYRLAREGAIKIFDDDDLRTFLRLEYSFLIVDEYQDCSITQHNLIMKLSEVTNCLIFGDPMQAIFDFVSEGFNWDTHVHANFEISEKVEPLETPHRWEKNECPELGKWISDTRKKLINDKREEVNYTCIPSHITTSSISVRPETETVQIANELSKKVPKKGSFLALIDGGVTRPHLRHSVAAKMSVPLESIERIDSSDLSRFLKKLDKFIINKNMDPIKLFELVRNFAKKCMTGTSALSDSLKPKLNQHGDLSMKELRDLGNRLGGSNSILHHLILDIYEVQNSKSTVRSIFVLMKNLSKDSQKKYRRELWYSALESLQKYLNSDDLSLKECGQKVRQKTSFIGRNLNRVIGTTLLTKGLEFDHVIIVDPDNLNNKNLYVALSRACKSICIINVQRPN